MSIRKLAQLALLSISSLWLVVPSSSATEPLSSAGDTAHLIVTVEPRHGSSPPQIHPEDVIVYEGRDRDQVTGLDSDQALQLFVLIDDGSGPGVGSQISDLQKFITSQPAATAVGLGYMRDGTVAIAQNLTTDHALAARSVRLPLGERGISPSPYLTIADLIKKWPTSHARREIVVITDGVDGLNGGGPTNTYLDEAIAAAQKAGIVIYSIYARGAGHYGHSFWQINWGQNYLAQLSEETGGEAYGLMMGSPVSFAPYLADIDNKLAHQYVLAFLPKPEKKAGERSITIRTEVPNVDLLSADKMYVPAEQAGQE